MMRYHLQDFSMSEHLQVINLLHISLYQRNFYVTLKWTIIIFIQILTLLFQGMMPHTSHIGGFRDSQSDVILAHAHIRGRQRIGQPH